MDWLGQLMMLFPDSTARDCDVLSLCYEAPAELSNTRSEHVGHSWRQKVSALMHVELACSRLPSTQKMPRDSRRQHASCLENTASRGYRLARLVEARKSMLQQ